MEQQGYGKPSGPPRRPFQGHGHDLPTVDHADWRGDLRRTILSRVVPRLSEAGAAPPDAPAPALTEAEVHRFADLALAAAVPALVQHVDGLRAQGLSIEAVTLQLLAPAARRLGDLWLDDALSFFDVTAALARLQGVMRALGPDFDGDGIGHVHGRRILLAPVSGEQHIFGLSVVAAFFRRAGWDVLFEPRIAFDDLINRVRAERFTAIGLSLASDRFLAGAPAQVEALRRASLDPNVTMLAGGPAILADPDLGRRVGVDAVARDAMEAVQVAEALSGQVATVRARR